MSSSTQPPEQPVIKTRSGSNRSKKNRGKNKDDRDLPERSPSSAVSDPPRDGPEGSSELSHSQPSQLPPNNVNKASAETVSDISFSTPQKRDTGGASTQPNSLISPDGPTKGSQQKEAEIKTQAQVGKEINSPEVEIAAVGDNTASASPFHLCQCGGAPKGYDQTVLTMVLEELKEIKTQMARVVKIETSTESLAKQLIEVSSKTSEIAESVASNAARLREVDDEIATIKTFVGKQECAINSLKKYKVEVAASTSKSVSQMNALVEEQQSQVEAFKSCTKVIKQDILREVDKSCEKVVKTELKRINDRVDSIASEAYCNRFKNQAYNNRLNLMVVGLTEDDQKSTNELVREFFSNTLKVGNAKFKNALRLGSKPGEGSHYSRPIVVKFANFEHKNEVWKNRLDITGENDSQKIRVLADVPKELREGVKLMYKVVRAATKAKVYGQARVQNYQLELNDKTYQFSELEKLPFPLRPSTLASPARRKPLLSSQVHLSSPTTTRQSSQ